LLIKGLHFTPVTLSTRKNPFLARECHCVKRLQRAPKQSYGKSKQKVSVPAQ
jgi:hypothetical protein